MQGDWESSRKPIGVEIRVLNNMITRFFELMPSHSEVEKLTGTNGWIIRFLVRNRHRDVFQKDLEQEFGITRSTASRVIDLMVQKGLVVRESVEHDARLKKLVLSEKALELSEKMKELGEAVDNALISSISEKELEDFYRVLQKLQNSMEQLINEQKSSNSERIKGKTNA